MSRPPTELKLRFWPKVGKQMNCWLWLARQHSRGYGLIRGTNGEARLAHRVAWELERGPIPKGVFVLHKCDNPPCVRPSHLFLGTQADNMHDMVSKRRHHGSKHKLDWKKVDQIRKHTDISTKTFAIKYDVSISLISQIRLNRAWKEHR